MLTNESQIENIFLKIDFRQNIFYQCDENALLLVSFFEIHSDLTHFFEKKLDFGFTKETVRILMDFQKYVLRTRRDC